MERRIIQIVPSQSPGKEGKIKETAERNKTKKKKKIYFLGVCLAYVFALIMMI